MTFAQRCYLVLADLILIVHVAFVAFVVVGLILVWLGRFCGWKFVRNLWFRVAHLGAIGVVVAESLAGWVCPLTTWENHLRHLAGGAERYQGSFMQHWLHQVLFFDLNENVFTALYVFFFVAVALSFWLVPPHWRSRRGERNQPSPND